MAIHNILHIKAKVAVVVIQEEEAEAITTPRQVAGPTTRLRTHTDTTRNSLLNTSHNHTARNTQDNTLPSIRRQVLADIPKPLSSHHSSGRIRDTSIMPLVLTLCRLRITIPTTLSTSIINSSSSSRPMVSSSHHHRSSSSSQHMEPLHHNRMASRTLLRNHQVVLLSGGVLQLPSLRTLPRTNPITSNTEVAVAVEDITTRLKRSQWGHQSGWALTMDLLGTPMLQ